MLRFLVVLVGLRTPASFARGAGRDAEPYYPVRTDGRGERRPLVSWPKALRAARGWLEPWMMLGRYWRAFTDLPPPKELRALLERVFAGEGIYLYVH